MHRARLLHPQASITLSGPDLVVQGDQAKIAGIGRNLVDNALRSAGPSGALHVTRAAPDHVVVEV